VKKNILVVLALAAGAAYMYSKRKPAVVSQQAAVLASQSLGLSGLKLHDKFAHTETYLTNKRMRGDMVQREFASSINDQSYQDPNASYNYTPNYND
jgi:hypothetical protein